MVLNGFCQKNKCIVLMPPFWYNIYLCTFYATAENSTSDVNLTWYIESLEYFLVHILCHVVSSLKVGLLKDRPWKSPRIQQIHVKTVLRSEMYSLKKKLHYKLKYYTVHRGAFCQLPFRWIYYCHNWQNAPLCSVLSSNPTK